MDEVQAHAPDRCTLARWRFEELERRPDYVQLAERLRESILSGALEPGSPVARGMLRRIVIALAAVLGGEHWRGFSVRLAGGWARDPAPDIAQWHGVGPEGGTGSPPLSIGTKDGRWQIGRNPDNHYSETKVGRYRAGRWTDWVVQVRWADDETGFLRVWRDGETVVEDERVQTRYSGRPGTYFKFGVYKWPWGEAERSVTQRRVVHFDEPRSAGRSGSYAAAAPRGGYPRGMSRNLVELVRRHHAEQAPTALTVLKQAMELRGEITDDDRRAASEASGLPEAAVYGVSTFYDDLLQPRGRRHVRVCTGTACFAATGDAHVDELKAAYGLGLGERAADGSVSLAETVCLGFCHTSPAVRVGDTIDAGPEVVARVLGEREAAAAEPEWTSLLAAPVLTRPGDWSGLARVRAELTPAQLLDAVKAADVRGRGGAGFPAGQKWAFAAAAEGDEKFVVCNGDEGDPGSYIDKFLMERNPQLLLEGMALAGFAVGARHGFVLTRSEYPLSKPRLDAAAARARDEGWLDDDFDVTIIEGAGSYVVGEETALLACVEGLRGVVSARPPFPAQRGLYGKPTVVNNVETLCNIPVIARDGAAAYPNSKLVCFNERFAKPGCVEVPFGMTVRELCEDVAGGLRDGRSIKAVQIGGPLGGILPAELLDARFDFDALAAHGCMVGHGSILAFDEKTDMRAVARHLLRFGAHESCGKCFPCRIGLRRAHAMFAADAPVSRAALEELLEVLEVGSLCAHGGGMPAPIRSLLTHWPDELGLT